MNQMIITKTFKRDNIYKRVIVNNTHRMLFVIITNVIRVKRHYIFYFVMVIWKSFSTTKQTSDNHHLLPKMSTWIFHLHTTTNASTDSENSLPAAETTLECSPGFVPFGISEPLTASLLQEGRPETVGGVGGGGVGTDPYHPDGAGVCRFIVSPAAD